MPANPARFPSSIARLKTFRPKPSLLWRFVAAAALAGCAAGPDLVRPDSALQEQALSPRPDYEARVYEREAFRVTLSAELAQTYLQLRGTQAQLDIGRGNLALAERLLRLAGSRERHGTGMRFDTASASAQLASVKSTVPELKQRRNTLLSALALLLGEQPRALDALLCAAMPLPALPPSIPVGLPSELARRRPDILRAEAQLHVATAAIGVAKADSTRAWACAHGGAWKPSTAAIWPAGMRASFRSAHGVPAAVRRRPPAAAPGPERTWPEGGPRLPANGTARLA